MDLSRGILVESKRKTTKVTLMFDFRGEMSFVYRSILVSVVKGDGMLLQQQGIEVNQNVDIGDHLRSED
jgi:hypothetical protein